MSSRRSQRTLDLLSDDDEIPARKPKNITITDNEKTPKTPRGGRKTSETITEDTTLLNTPRLTRSMSGSKTPFTAVIGVAQTPKRGRSNNIDQEVEEKSTISTIKEVAEEEALESPEVVVVPKEDEEDVGKTKRSRTPKREMTPKKKATEKTPASPSRITRAMRRGSVETPQKEDIKKTFSNDDDEIVIVASDDVASTPSKQKTPKRAKKVSASEIVVDEYQDSTANPVADVINEVFGTNSEENVSLSPMKIDRLVKSDKKSKKEKEKSKLVEFSDVAEEGKSKKKDEVSDSEDDDFIEEVQMTPQRKVLKTPKGKASSSLRRKVLKQKTFADWLSEPAAPCDDTVVSMEWSSCETKEEENAELGEIDVFSSIKKFDDAEKAKESGESPENEAGDIIIEEDDEVAVETKTETPFAKKRVVKTIELVKENTLQMRVGTPKVFAPKKGLGVAKEENKKVEDVGVEVEVVDMNSDRKDEVVVEEEVEVRQKTPKKKKEKKRNSIVQKIEENNGDIEEGESDDKIEEIAVERLPDHSEAEKMKKNQKKRKNVSGSAAEKKTAVIVDKIKSKRGTEGVAEKSKKVLAEMPDINGFDDFFSRRTELTSQLTSSIADTYAWASRLDPSADDLHLPFMSTHDEVVWSYLKHRNTKLATTARKYKTILDELIGGHLINVSKREPKYVNEEDEDIDDEEDEDIDDVEDEDLEDDDEEEEEDVDLFNLKEDDLKNLERDLEAMENEDEEKDGEDAEKNEEEDLKKYPKSVVDDEFFNLAEMNDFLEKQERVGAQKDDVLFDEEEWDGKADYTYEDFFGKKAKVAAAKTSEKKGKKRRNEEAEVSIDEGKNKKRVRFAMDEEEPEDVEGDEDEDMENEYEMEDEEGPVLLGASLDEEKEETNFAKRQKKMRVKISTLEEENLAPRSWELSGEVAADQRKRNALLEQHVDFDHGTKKAPEVTEEFTDKLESLIVQRIKDKAFDDVVRVKKIEEKGPKFRAEALEDIHAQKTSLAEVYEKEYQKSVGEGGDSKEKTNPAHEEIKSKMSKLFRLLDALTHFEYTPPQAMEEVKVVNNMASLRVEEVGAMASSEAQLVAPEEVSKRVKGDVKGEDERDKTDKLRGRRKKKSKQRALLLKLGEESVFGEQKSAKLAKKKAKENGSNDAKDKIKSSNFFSKLQDTVQQEKREKTKKKKVKSEKTTANSASIKL